MIRRRSPIRFFGWGIGGRKLVKPTPDDGKLRLADFLLCIATLIVVRADKFDAIPDFPYKSEVINSVAIILILLSFYSYFHKLCPMSRWGRSSWATGMTAAAWTAIPLILYATGVNDDWAKMLNYSIWSSVIWAAFLFCLYKLWRVRVRTRATVAMIDWRIRNNKSRR